MPERLQKIISESGFTSRRSAEKLISDGRVTVNGHTAVIGEKADPETDFILIDGKPLSIGGEKVYVMLNKPRGYVTTMSDEKCRKDVSMLTADAGVRLYPVGRLDLNSEGLLIMTNDGEFANRLMHPSNNILKTYEVIAAFRTRVLTQDEPGFRYYNYTDLSDEETFQEFITNVRAMAAYDTGVEAVFGDDILTLSTCAYHTRLGRFVIVAKRVVEE